MVEEPTTIGTVVELAQQPDILVVDDDHDIREALAEVLELEGYRVATASNGSEALDLLRARPGVRLILLDLMMPTKTGWEFRAEQKQDAALASIPVVVISASGQAQSIDAAGFINKPVDVDRLLRAVDKTIAAPGAGREMASRGALP